MASALNNLYPSIFPLKSESETAIAGRVNPTELPLLKISTIGATIGKKITQGAYGGIYNVNGSNPRRVYKIIPLERFESGDEIRISKIAAQAGIAPYFYGACVVQQEKNKFVLMEMDFAGKTLFGWMEDLALEPDVSKAALIDGESRKQKAMAKAMRELAEKKDDGSGWACVSLDKVESISTDEAIDKLYTSREDFFRELFTVYKILAENNIAYRDSNCNNLIPNRGQGFQLIDFDSASIEDSPAEAASKTLASVYNQIYFKDFCALKELSPESRELIEWFQAQPANALNPLMESFAKAAV